MSSVGVCTAVSVSQQQNTEAPVTRVKLSGRETQYSSSVFGVKMFHSISSQNRLAQLGSVGKQSRC